ncbi:hypothetical protein N431DRAFT_455056 [Stipitochalara longipes BDJ]|nr:hypothetical protein N431DRAFT_455056 [Stipitochalara longipes BDJ]
MRAIQESSDSCVVSEWKRRGCFSQGSEAELQGCHEQLSSGPEIAVQSATGTAHTPDGYQNCRVRQTQPPLPRNSVHLLGERFRVKALRNSAHRSGTKTKAYDILARALPDFPCQQCSECTACKALIAANDGMKKDSLDDARIAVQDPGWEAEMSTP